MIVFKRKNVRNWIVAFGFEGKNDIYVRRPFSVSSKQANTRIQGSFTSPLVPDMVVALR